MTQQDPTTPDRTVRVTKLQDQGKENDLDGKTPEECVDMMWQLAVDAWAFMGVNVVESEFSRHVGRVIRGKR